MVAKDKQNRPIYQDFDPEAPETTEFRRIFTRISRRGQTEKMRSLLFTSSERGEGKTTSASMFAMVAALHQGLRVCLVDADLHRPRIDKLFEVSKEPGLAEILGEELSIEAALKTTRHETLQVLPAGGRRPFPSELLIPDRLAATFSRLKLLFDLVVVDAPPLLPVSDPAVLSREVDGVAMVVRAGRTQRDVALRAKKILDDVGANLLGAIVNNADDVLPYYYGHSYYQYSGYGSDAEKSEKDKEEGGRAPRGGDAASGRSAKARSRARASRSSG
ncbi:MAG: CpsD/CapB family tyrosine-protein kinase [bacterium]